MKYIMTLETADDLIVVCRLLNIFRRKGVRLHTLVLSLAAEASCLMVILEMPEHDVEHMFHFLRRTEGIRHVTYYRHQLSGPASFVFIDGHEESPCVQGFGAGSRLIFASHGKALMEIPAGSAPQTVSLAFSGANMFPFARVRTTHDQAGP